MVFLISTYTIHFRLDAHACTVSDDSNEIDHLDIFLIIMYHHGYLTPFNSAYLHGCFVVIPFLWP